MERWNNRNETKGLKEDKDNGESLDRGYISRMRIIMGKKRIREMRMAYSIWSSKMKRNDLDILYSRLIENIDISSKLDRELYKSRDKFRERIYESKLSLKSMELSK